MSRKVACAGDEQEDSSDRLQLHLVFTKCVREREKERERAVGKFSTCSCVCVLKHTSTAGHAALQDLLHPHCHVGHVLGYGLDPLH